MSMVCLALTMALAAAAEGEAAPPARPPGAEASGANAGAVAAVKGDASPEISSEEHPVMLDEVTVTVTRSARRSKDVPQAVAVIGKERIADANMFSVKEVIAGTPGVLIDSKNGGNDVRLLIRGAGLKAPYGVREIMVLRDGVPLTDPDSMTRFDWIDTQDIERIEIAKGPGNLYSTGSAGGAIQIFSKSVFDESGNLARAGLGQQGAGNMHLRTTARTGDQAWALSASYRGLENDWRAWNNFVSRQASLKHGVLVLGDGQVESELAYTESSVQLPGTLNQALYEAYLETGKQEGTSEVWKHSGRYSTILFFNTKLEKPLSEAVKAKARVYYNQWRHLHPVTGLINDSADWTHNLGSDLEAAWRHGGGALTGSLVFGLTARSAWNDDSRKYQYRDVTTSPTGRITATLSDARGELAETERQRNLLVGAFAQETLRIWDRVTVDVGARFDTSRFHVQANEITRYDYAQGKYLPGAGWSTFDRTFNLPAPKLGVSVAVLPELSLYASVAQADQVPSQSEFSENPGLRASRTVSSEVGAKGRGARWSLDLAVYQSDVKDEIVATVENGVTVFDNAGETHKLGVEVSGLVRLGLGLELQVDYAYSDFHFDSYAELVNGAPVSRDGNALPFIPVHQWGGALAWRHASGLRARLSARTWGAYWMDTANTQRYGGYEFLTSAGAAYQRGAHELALQVENLRDQRYAVQASKDSAGKVTYAVAAPRSLLVSYAYRF